MKRRSLLAGGASGLLASCAGGAIGPSGALVSAQKPAPTPTLVLVHGAWHGAWCWERVTPLLAEAGYRCVAVSLPGMGERKSGLSLAIDLDSHIDAVAEAARAVQGPVVLVGHSYGGFVITGAADRIASGGRLQSLVYVDAFVPAAGEKVADHMPEPARSKLAASLAAGDPAYPPVPARFFGIEKPRDIEWVEARLTAQPAATYFQPLRLGPTPPVTRRGYIACQSPRLPVFDDTKARVRADPAWTYRELPTGHDAMVIAPAALAASIVSLVSAA